MPVLPKGANAPLSSTRVVVALEWRESAVSHDVDLCGLVLGSDGRVRDDADFVFYNQPSHPSGAVTHAGRTGTVERLDVDLDRLSDDVEKVALVASISQGTFGDVEGLAVAVLPAAEGGDELRFDAMGATVERAFVVGELYRRNGQWKFRAVGQGWEAGLAALATNFGVGVEEPAETEAVAQPRPATTSPAGPTGRPVPGDHPAPRLLPRARVAPDTPRLDGAGLTLPIGQQLSLLQQGATPQSLWLRVRRTSPEGAGRPDLAVLAYDEYGAPGSVVHFGSPTGALGNVQLVPPTKDDAADDLAAVELRLAALDGSISDLVVAITSYDGRPLAANGAFVTELIAADGTVHARSECPAPDTTATLLLSLRRDTAGAWVLTPLASAAAARTAKGLTGAGRWALTG